MACKECKDNIINEYRYQFDRADLLTAAYLSCPRRLQQLQEELEEDCFCETETPTVVLQPWECPKCGHVHAPTTPSCLYCPQGSK